MIAWADLNCDGVRDAGEPSATASKTWTAIDAVATLAAAHEICKEVTREDHRSLPILCSLLDELPPKAQEAVAEVIVHIAEDRHLHHDRDDEQKHRQRDDDDGDDGDD